MKSGSFFPVILSVILSMVISIPLCMLLRKMGFGKTKGERIVESAKKAGRVTEGHLVKSKSSLYDPGADTYNERRSVWHATYQYTVGRRSYTFKTTMDGYGPPPPETILLYYPSGKPQKAIAEGSLKHDTRDYTVALVPFIVWVILYMAVFK